MPAPKGNQFWKLRSKHGVSALFTEPEKLWEAAVEYFQWSDENPITRWEQAKGPVIIPKNFEGVVGDIKPLVEVPVGRPYTIHGLGIYLGCSITYWKEFKTSNTYKESEEFKAVVSRIEEIIYRQKFDGASAGIFNHNIIARDLGLRENMNLGNQPGETFDVTLKIE